MLAQYDLASIDPSQLKDKFSDSLRMNLNTHRFVIRTQLLKLLQCTIDCMIERRDATSVVAALSLRAALGAKCWADTASVLKQLNGVGDKTLITLISNGIDSFDKLGAADPRDLECMFRRNPPFGNVMLKDLESFPRYKCQLEQQSQNKLDLGVQLKLQLEIRLEAPVTTAAREVMVNVITQTADGDLLDFRRWR